MKWKSPEGLKKGGAQAHGNRTENQAAPYPEGSDAGGACQPE